MLSDDHELIMDLLDTQNRKALNAVIRAGRYPQTQEQRAKIVDWLFDGLERARDSGNLSALCKLANTWINMDKLNLDDEPTGPAGFADNSPQVIIVVPDNGKMTQNGQAAE